MGDFSSLALLFLIISLFAIILIYLQQDEYFKDFNINSSSNSNTCHISNTNNNSNNLYYQGKSPYKSFPMGIEPNFIGLNNWKKKYQKGNCIHYQKYPLEFKRYVKNTPLKYDGLWKKKNSGHYYTWSLK